MSLVTGVDLAFPGRLQPTSLDLRAGEITCLIGPNGSGKTSLLHAFAGIGKPGGEVRIAGVDPLSLPPGQRSAFLSFLAASHDLVWPLAARDLVALGLRGADAADKAGTALALFELDALASRRVDRLSTGERSRVLIARAWAAQSKLLLLDEPTANLDPLWQIRLMAYLKARARDQQCAILTAIHDLDLARRHADRLLIVDRGRIAADGKVDELLASEHMPAVFGINWSQGEWRPLKPQADRQSSR